MAANTDPESTERIISAPTYFMGRYIPLLKAELPDRGKRLSDRIFEEPLEDKCRGADIIKPGHTLTLSTLMGLIEVGIATANQGFASATDLQFKTCPKELEFLGESVYGLICDRENNRGIWASDAVIHDVEFPNMKSPGEGYRWVHYVKGVGFNYPGNITDQIIMGEKSVCTGLWIPPEGHVVPDKNGQLFHSVTGTPLKTTTRGSRYATDQWVKASLVNSHPLLDCDDVPYFVPSRTPQPLVTGVRLVSYRDGTVGFNSSVRIDFQEIPGVQSRFTGQLRISESA